MVDVPVANTINSPQFGTFNQQIPVEGPKVVPIGPLDFNVNTSYLVDLTLQINQAKIAYIQGLYCDNSSNPLPLVVTNLTTQQIVTWPPYSQGYLPFIASNPPKFTIRTSAGNFLVEVYAYNIPLPACIWTSNPPSSSGAIIHVSDNILDATVQNNKVGVSDKTIYTPLGYQQLTGMAAATALTVPSGAIMAIIECDTQAVRWRDDAVAPTAAVGMPLATGAYFIYNASLSALQFIQQTSGAILNVSYYS